MNKSAGRIIQINFGKSDALKKLTKFYRFEWSENIFSEAGAENYFIFFMHLMKEACGKLFTKERERASLQKVPGHVKSERRNIQRE